LHLFTGLRQGYSFVCRERQVMTSNADTGIVSLPGNQSVDQTIEKL
jgi:hypothetical protein